MALFQSPKVGRFTTQRPVILNVVKKQARSRKEIKGLAFFLSWQDCCAGGPKTRNRTAGLLKGISFLLGSLAPQIHQVPTLCQAPRQTMMLRGVGGRDTSGPPERGRQEAGSSLLQKGGRVEEG